MSLPRWKQICMEFSFLYGKYIWLCRKCHSRNLAEKTDRGEVCQSCYFTDSQDGKRRNAKTTKLQSGDELPWNSRSLQLGGSTSSSVAKSSAVFHTTFGGLVRAICPVRTQYKVYWSLFATMAEAEQLKTSSWPNLSCLPMDSCDHVSTAAHSFFKHSPVCCQWL